MSAYIVDADVVDVLARAATTHLPYGHGLLSWTWPDPEGGCRYATTSFDGQTGIGRMLLRENERSIMARYPDTLGDDDAALLGRMPGPVDYAGWEAYEFPRRSFPMPEPVHVLGIMACYEYQACEHPGWRDSEAYGFCRSLTSRLHQQLPGYAAAPWNYSHPRGVREVAA